MVNEAGGMSWPITAATVLLVLWSVSFFVLLDAVASIFPKFNLAGETVSTVIGVGAGVGVGVAGVGVGVAGVGVGDPPPSRLSVNTIAGDAPPTGLQGATKVRLFVSPVKPSSSQEGAFVVPSSTLVLTTIVDPLLKIACDPQQSPKMLNSASCQPSARLRTLSSPDAE